MTKNKLAAGDFIKCRDKKDAAEIAEQLTQLGYIWDFCFERKEQKGIWIEIKGRYVDGCKRAD